MCVCVCVCMYVCVYVTDMCVCLMCQKRVIQKEDKKRKMVGW